MRWAFWRPSKPQPPRHHVGPTSVDWQIGDLAECVGHFDHQPAPKIGDRLMVSRVEYGNAWNQNTTLFGLWFVGFHNRGFDSRCFRKIVATDVGADRTVSKRRPVRVDA